MIIIDSFWYPDSTRLVCLYVSFLRACMRADGVCMCQSIFIHDIYDIDWLLSRSCLISHLEIVNIVIAVCKSNFLSGLCNQRQ